jgi:rod shape determining protein RodA
MAERPGKRIDWMTFSLYLALVGVGWLMIYAVGNGEDYSQGLAHFLFDTQVGKQTIWIGISFIVFFFTFLIDLKFWSTFAYPVYGIGLLMLILVLIFGREIKGATSWFSIGGFTLQPSEFAKFATNLAVASFLSAYRTNMRDFRSQIIAFGLFLAPMGLILLQPDAGSALVFFSFLVVLYREGFPSNFFVLGFFLVTLLLLGFVFPPLQVLIGLGLAAGVVLVFQFERKLLFVTAWLALAFGIYYFFEETYAAQVLLTIGVLVLALLVINWLSDRRQLANLIMGGLVVGGLLVFASDFAFNNFLQPHQQDRINVWLNPEKCDPQGSLYNVLQSKMAIGSGGFKGKGFTKGNLTSGNFVPEQATDFIFCTVGEEQGFIGSFGIIMLFLLLVIRITMLAERQRSNFARCYAYGVAAILFVHVIVNIGMTMGLMPIIGIPLPFISKGGSSLLGFTILIAVLIRLDTQRYEL